jgi:hypothetical protein
MFRRKYLSLLTLLALSAIAFSTGDQDLDHSRRPVRNQRRRTAALVDPWNERGQPAAHQRFMKPTLRHYLVGEVMFPSLPILEKLSGSKPHLVASPSSSLLAVVCSSTQPKIQSLP